MLRCPRTYSGRRPCPLRGRCDRRLSTDGHGRAGPPGVSRLDTGAESKVHLGVPVPRSGWCSAGWFSWQGVMRPRMRRSSCFATRWRCCVGRSPVRGWTGLAVPCSPPWPGCWPLTCGCTGLSHRARLPAPLDTVLGRRTAERLRSQPGRQLGEPGLLDLAGVGPQGLVLAVQHGPAGSRWPRPRTRARAFAACASGSPIKTPV